MLLSARRALLAVVSALWLAATPAAAAAPCLCPEDAHAPAATEAAAGCHGEETPAPTDSHNTTDPCQASCGACATAANLTEGGPGPGLLLHVHLDPTSPPAMRAGERRPPDHIPLASV